VGCPPEELDGLATGNPPPAARWADRSERVEQLRVACEAILGESDARDESER